MSTFKTQQRVRITSGQYEGAVGIVEMVQEPFDDEPGAALVTISGIVKEEHVTVTDWFFFDDLEIAA